MERVLDIDGLRWAVVALPEEVGRREADQWHYSKVRFEPRGHTEYGPKETWLRREEDVPARDVLDQYGDEELIEVFLVAEEVGPTETSE